MTTRTRFGIILITAPVLAFAVVGGLLGKTMGGQETYPHLRVFDDVFSLTTGNYVEEVDVDRLMHGAMHGLADALDADSAYLTAAQTKAVAVGSRRRPRGRRAGPDAPVLPPGHRGARELPRREGRAAARRLHPDDRHRTDARHVGVGGHAAAAGRPGNGRDARRAARQRRRTARGGADARGAAGAAVRRRGCSRRRSATCAWRSSRRARRPRCGKAAARLQGEGARALILDLRGSARGPLEAGIDVGARVRRQRHAGDRSSRAARAAARSARQPGDGAITLPVAVLTDFGTAGPGRAVRRRARPATSAPRRSANARPAARPCSGCSRCPMAAACGCRTRGTSRRPASPFTSGGFSRMSPVRPARRRVRRARPRR